MNSQEYLINMLQSNKRIYIDTATLMEVEWMKAFIENYEEILLEFERKIIVPKAVCLELAKHMESDNERKSKAALETIGILSHNQDIFEVHNEAITEGEIAKVFADCQLLTELTINKRETGQLLITNDRKLSRDAYNLNGQESYRGFKIMVCYLNRFGELHMCQCVKDSMTEEQLHEDSCQEIADKEDSKTEQIVLEEEKKSNGIWGKVGIVFASFIAGIVVDELCRARRYA